MTLKVAANIRAGKTVESCPRIDDDDDVVVGSGTLQAVANSIATFA